MIGLKESRTKSLKGKKKEVGCLGTTELKERLRGFEFLCFSYCLLYAPARARAQHLSWHNQQAQKENLQETPVPSSQKSKTKQPF